MSEGMSIALCPRGAMLNGRRALSKLGARQQWTYRLAYRLSLGVERRLRIAAVHPLRRMARQRVRHVRADPRLVHARYERRAQRVEACPAKLIIRDA